MWAGRLSSAPGCGAGPLALGFRPQYCIEDFLTRRTFFSGFSLLALIQTPTVFIFWGYWESCIRQWEFSPSLVPLGESQLVRKVEEREEEDLDLSFPSLQRTMCCNAWVKELLPIQLRMAPQGLELRTVGGSFLESRLDSICVMQTSVLFSFFCFLTSLYLTRTALAGRHWSVTLNSLAVLFLLVLNSQGYFMLQNATLHNLAFYRMRLISGNFTVQYTEPVIESPKLHHIETVQLCQILKTEIEARNSTALYLAFCMKIYAVPLQSRKITLPHFEASLQGGWGWKDRQPSLNQC